MHTKEEENLTLVLDIRWNQFENMKINRQTYESSSGVDRLVKNVKKSKMRKCEIQSAMSNINDLR